MPTPITVTQAGEDSNSDVQSIQVTLANGSGNDRLLAIVTSAARGAVRSVTGVTLDGTPGTVWNQTAIDGASGIAASSAVCYFTDSQLPTLADEYTLVITWNLPSSQRITSALEYEDIPDQTTPLKNYASNTDTVVADGATISSTIANADGDSVVTFLATADPSSTAASNTVPSGSTLLGTKN